MAQGIPPRVRSVCLAAAVVALLPVIAAAYTGPEGTWVGRMKAADGQEFEVKLVLDGMGAGWKGTLSDPNIGELPLQDLTVTATRISFTFRPENVPFPANFSGSYVAAHDRVTGTFSLRGNSRFVKFERVPDGGGHKALADAAPAEPARVRHAHKVALTGRLSWWPSLHMVKDENYNLNDMTAASGSADLGLKWFAADEFCLFARFYRGGQSATDAPEKIARYEDIGFSSDSYLRLDGWEIGMTGFLGDVMMPNSRFNPYVTAAFGSVSWEQTVSGRGSDVIVMDRYALEGDDLGVLFGLGTEYQMSPDFALEFEWAWRYFSTEDTDKWPDPDNTWSNTHAWTLSLGLTWGFW